MITLRWGSPICQDAVRSNWQSKLWILILQKKKRNETLKQVDGLPPSEFRILGEKCSARWTSLGFTSLIIQIEGQLRPKNSHKFTSWHSLDVRDERNRRMEFSTSSVMILNVICCFFWAFSLLWNIQKTKFSTSSVIMLLNFSQASNKKIKIYFQSTI